MNKQERTQAIINNFRDNPDEFAMLKGILCMSHGPEAKDDSEYKVFRGFVDTLMIAERMDEINRRAIASVS